MLLNSYSKVTQQLFKKYFDDPTLFESYFAELHPSHLGELLLALQATQLHADKQGPFFG